jgi:hypothetical protein
LVAEGILVANLQAIGADGVTIIYLLAEGTGTDLEPYISKFKLVDHELLATESTLAALKDKLPQLVLSGDRLLTSIDPAVTYSTELNEATLAAIVDAMPEFVFDGDRLLVKTELSQPLTLMELESATVLTAIQAILDKLTFLEDRLKVKTELNQPLTLTELQALTVKTEDQNLVAFGDLFAWDGDRLKVKTELSQPLTLAQLQGLIVKTQEQVPLDISALATKANQDTNNSQIGARDEAPPATDTALSGLNGRLQRLAQRLTTVTGLIGEVQLTPTAYTILGRFKALADLLDNRLDFSGLSTTTNQVLTNTRIGDLTEPPPSSDTASSGLNGRLQRIAQRITSLIALFPSSLGAKTAANSLAVTLASDGVASGIANQIGEVQTNPTQFTLLDRLKAIVAALSNVTLASEAGFLCYRNTALSSTPQSIKSSAGGVMGWNFININTVPVYVKFFNITAGSVVVGTSPITLTILVPPSDGITPGLFLLEPGLVPFEVFSTAISIACVTGLADNSTTAPTTPIHISVRYK